MKCAMDGLALLLFYGTYATKPKKPGCPSPPKNKLSGQTRRKKNHNTVIYQPENVPFVVACYSHWQKDLLEGALNWCLGSTRHSCKSTTNLVQYC
ncbi:hypothetical protein BC941DRAFT_427654 [Chlamydoabsidia padenii]|nr:hypothetical protein BC941DRAFT_427654 [Chlamydoabsidia padenii]